MLAGSSRSQLWIFQRTSHVNYPEERPTGLLSRREATKPTHHRKGAVAAGSVHGVALRMELVYTSAVLRFSRSLRDICTDATTVHRKNQNILSHSAAFPHLTSVINLSLAAMHLELIHLLI